MFQNLKEERKPTGYRKDDYSALGRVLFIKGGDSNLLGKVAARETREMVNKAIAELAADERVLVEARFRDDMTFAEIGKMVGCSEATAFRRVNRICEKLEEKLPSSLMEENWQRG